MIARGMAEGAAAALPIIDALAAEPTLQNYHLLAATRADLLRRLERWKEAAVEYRRAIAMASNTRERDFLQMRLTECEAH